MRKIFIFENVTFWMYEFWTRMTIPEIEPRRWADLYIIGSATNSSVSIFFQGARETLELILTLVVDWKSKINLEISGRFWYGLRTEKMQ